MRLVTRSMRLSLGYLEVSDWLWTNGDSVREELGGTALVDPGSSQGLEVCLSGGASIVEIVVEDIAVAVEVLEDVGDVHGYGELGMELV